MSHSSFIPSDLPVHTFTFRVRYAETDQMGTFYNARALEWFEVGRSELARSFGLPYSEWESRGAFLPLVESYVRYLGRARYDDLLSMSVSVQIEGRARLKFFHEISHSEGGQAVVRGHTLHVVVNKQGRPMKIPDWILSLVSQ